MRQDADLLGLDRAALGLREASAVTPQLMSGLIATVCHRLQAIGATGKTTRVAELIRFGAWTDAALVLIDLELPLWHVRRIAYDEGEWYCALSRERELPDWLDRSVEASHADLALAILSALVEVRRLGAQSTRTSVPAVKPSADILYEVVGAENFS